MFLVSIDRVDLNLLSFGSIFTCFLHFVFILNFFFSLSKDSLECELIWAIRLPAATFVL
jgi:hypothetical protein